MLFFASALTTLGTEFTGGAAGLALELADLALDFVFLLEGLALGGFGLGLV